MAKKFYAVLRGYRPGVYDNWDDAQAQVRGFSGARHRGFQTRSQAEEWLQPGESAEPPLSLPPRALAAPSSVPSSARRPFSTSSSPAVTPPQRVYPRSSKPAQSLVNYLYCDGASRGNPGLSGCGGVVFVPSGEVLCTYKHFIPGAQTNNVAEYMGLIKGLTIAQSLHLRYIHVYADSTLIVQQSKGEWAVNAEHLLPYREQVQGLLRSFDWWEVTQVPREQNTMADRLSNEAINERSDNVVNYSDEAPAVGEGSAEGEEGEDGEDDEDQPGLKRGRTGGGRRAKRTRYLPPGEVSY